MERLTIIDRCGDVCAKYEGDDKDFDLDDWYFEVCKKLAHYEDLEDSGLLLKLPHPIGTPLFIPCKKQGVKQDHIRRWQTNNKGLMFCSNGSFYVVDAIGKSVFLTHEEAELKLKEIQNEPM